MAPPWVFVSEKYAGLNRVKHCSELILSSSMPKKCAHSKILFEGRDSVRDGGRGTTRGVCSLISTLL